MSFKVIQNFQNPTLCWMNGFSLSLKDRRKYISWEKIFTKKTEDNQDIFQKSFWNFLKPAMNLVWVAARPESFSRGVGSRVAEVVGRRLPLAWIPWPSSVDSSGWRPHVSIFAHCPDPLVLLTFCFLFSPLFPPLPALMLLLLSLVSSNPPVFSFFSSTIPGMQQLSS